MTAFHKSRMTLALMLCVLLASSEAAQAQSDQIWIGAPGTPSNWNTSNNWSPIASAPNETFDQIGVINNGGIAFLDSAAAFTAGGLRLGRFDDTSGGEGTLEVRSGGSLTIQNNGVTDGALIVGDFAGGGFTGTLDIQSGGSVATDFMDIRGGNSSVIVSGNGSLNATLINASNDLRLVGPSANVTTSTLQLFGGGNVVAEITGNSHSSISVTGIARLGGSVELDFNGHNPSLGDSWTLINAGAVVGDFTVPQVTSNVTPGAGQSYVLTKSNTQVNVSLENVLTLKVDRDSGVVSIDNDSASSLGFNAYSIRSGGGSLNSGNWQSLSSGPFPNFQEANPSANQLGEIDPAGSASFNASSSQSLGALYAPAALVPFGTPLASAEDLVFSYQRDTDGETITGLVEYTGDLLANNLVLAIDPTSGDATVTNDSNMPVSIDSYTVASASNSLLANWNSLSDQSVLGWEEASPSIGRISELNPTGDLTLNPGETFTLEGLWNTLGLQDASDYSFSFRETTLGTIDGIVEFVSAGADADADGDVDGADFLLLQLTNPSLIPTWQASYGPGSVSAATAVPEPTSLATLILGIMLVVGSKRLG